MLRGHTSSFLVLLALGVSCGDGSRRDTDSAGHTGSGITITPSTTTSTAGETTPTTTNSGSGSQSETDAEPTTTASTEVTTVASSEPTSTSTGPNMLCSPGATQCVDAASFQTCAADGQSWQGPTLCGEKEACDLGACLSLCAKAQNALSSVGCEYYAVDTNNDPAEGYDSQPYAVVVSNVDLAHTADVQVQVHDGNAWATIQQAQVGPNSLYQFDLPDRHVNYTNLNPRGAYKVISDVPIIAYQFQPINGQTSFTSDASLLLPVAVYDNYYYVVGWGASSYGNAQLNIVAAQDETTVTITPTVNTLAGGPITAMPANQPYTLPTMNEADVIQIESSSGLSGTYITSDKPIAVFSTHWCANIPNSGSCCCDHLEEQVYGLQTWGTTYVASRFPVRNNGTPEPSYWHLFAAEDNTQVHVDRHPDVTGIPNPDFVMNKGELMTMVVGGTVANPGDFVVSADKPIYLMQYMSSSVNTNVSTIQAGDPAMAQGVPVEQFRSNYVILIPSAWQYDRLVLTKQAGATVILDGQPVGQDQFTAVGETPTGWQVARVPADDGVHVLEGDQPFGVVVIGYDAYDSYAYPGGLDQKQINPQ